MDGSEGRARMNEVNRTTAIAVAVAAAACRRGGRRRVCVRLLQGRPDRGRRQVAGVDVGGMREGAAARQARGRARSGRSSARRVTIAGRRFRLRAERSGACARRRRDGRRSRRPEPLGRPAVPRLARPHERRRQGGRCRPASTTPRPPCGASSAGQAAVNRHARDARVQFAIASLPVIPSQTGLRVNRPRLLRRWGRGSVAWRRAPVRVKVRVVQPKVTTAELAEQVSSTSSPSIAPRSRSVSSSA